MLALPSRGCQRPRRRARRRTSSSSVTMLSSKASQRDHAAGGTTMDMDLSNATVAQVLVPVRDLDRAVEFYRSTLGIPFLFTAPPQMAFFQCGSVRLLVGVPPEGQAVDVGAGVYFRVADVHAVFETLRMRDVAF